MTRLLIAMLLACAGLCPAQLRIDLSGPWQLEVIEGPRDAPAVYELPRGDNAVLVIREYWLRREFTVPPGTDTGRLVLTLGSVGEVYDVFVNEVRIASRGSRRVSQITTARPATYPIPPGLLIAGQNRVALRVWRPRMRRAAPYLNLGGVADGGPYEITYAVNAPPNVASHEMGRRERAGSPDLALGVFHLIIGLVVGIAWWSERGRRDLFWMGCYQLCESVLRLQRYVTIPLDLPYSASTLFGPGITLSAGCLTMFALGAVAMPAPLRWAVAWIPLALHVSVNGYVASWDTDFSIIGNAVQYLGILMGVQVLVTVVLMLGAWRGATAQTRLVITATMAAIILRATVLSFFNPLASLNRTFVTNGFNWTLYDVAASVLMAIMTGLLLRSLGADRREKQRLAGELEAARIVQQVLLPPPVHSAIAAAYIPAQEVGGDFYQVLDGGTVVVGDVSGKGLQAAMRVALLVGVLRETRERAPGRVLEAMNRALAAYPDGGFVTCCCVQLGDGGTVRVASAGHPAPWVDGVELGTMPGLPLGLDGDAKYDETEHRLSDGGQLTLVTDGVIEAASAGGELFGFERTRAIAGKSAKEIAATAQAWGQNDDITVVTVRRLG